MELKNGYKVIYEKIADGTRTFYATKNVKCDPKVDNMIVKAEIGEYRLIYEKNGQFYGSESGIPTDGDHCFVEFDEVFAEKSTSEASIEEPTQVVESTTEPEAENEPEEEIGEEE